MGRRRCLISGRVGRCRLGAVNLSAPRHGVNPDRARGRFHGIKQGDRSQGGGRGRDDYKVNPVTGDVVAPDGEIVGNLGE